MSPNKTKSSEKSETSTKSNKTEVNKEVLNDENWKCIVVFLYEGDTCGLNLANTLKQIPVKQISGSLKVINKNDLLKDVKKGGGKVKKSSGKSQEEDKELSDEQIILMCVKDGVIPGKPLASVIKKQLINMKVEDVKERQKLLAAFENKKKKKDKVTSKESKRGKDVKGVSEDTAESDVFVEKPPMFVILLGFNEHDLPVELSKLDVPIFGVVKLISRQNSVESKKNDKSESLIHLNSDKFNMPWLAFWRKYDLTINCPENVNTGNDIATIEYKIPEELENIKDKKNFANSHLTEIMNLVQNLLEKHKKYCKSLVVTNMSDELMNEKPDLYNTLIQMVPLECTSIQFILFTLIEQVCHWNGDEIDIDVNSDTKSCISENINIINDDINISHRCNFQPLKKKKLKPSPVIIRNNDELSIKSFHLDIPEIDLNNIGIRFLSKSVLLKHWQLNKPDHMQYYFLEFHLQRLWKLAYTELSLNVFCIYLHIFIFGKMKSYYTSHLKNFRNSIDSMNVNSNSANHNLLLNWMNELKVKEKIELPEHKTDHINIEDPLITSKGNDFITNTTNSINGQKKTDSIDYKLMTETSDSNSYIINNISDISELTEQYSVFEITKKRNRNLSVLSKFLNCPEIICLYEKNMFPMAVATFKSINNYKFIEEMKPAALLQSVHEAVFNYSQIHSVYYYPSNKVLLWFHNNHKEIVRDYRSGRLESVLGFRDYCNTVIETENNMPKKNESTLEKDNTKLNDQEAGTGMNNRNSMKDDDVVDFKTPIYNLGKRKLQFDQWIKTFSSKDGSRVVVSVEDWHQTSQFINICIKKIDTEINVYVDKWIFLLDNYMPEKNKPVETMRLSLILPKDIILNVRVEEEVDFSEKDQVPQIQFIYHDLTITLPNGLVIQVLKNSYDNNNIYVKQGFTVKGLTCNKIWEEKYRCFDRSGAVVVFKNDDTIEVLYSGMAMGKIIKVDKSVAEKVEDIVTEVKAEQPKKETSKKESRKGKNKPIEPVSEEPKVEEKVQILPCIVLEHVIKSWSGISYHFRGNVCIEVIDNNVNLRSIFLPSKQLYIDRNDSHKSFYTDDGKLVSTYRDGTMITSFVYEEPDYIDIDFLTTEVEEQESDGRSNEMHLSDYFDFSTQNYVDSNDETYVSYKSGYITEHPNYGTVKFSPNDDSITLTLPGNLIICIYNIQKDGTYSFSVNVNNKAVTKFTKESIVFKSNITKKYKKPNITTISPIFLMNYMYGDDMYFCRTIDSYDHLFLVNVFGHVKLSDLESEDRKNSPQFSEKDEFYYENSVPNKMKERFFVVKDNFSGYEILHQNDIQLLDNENKMRFRNVDTVKNPRKYKVFSKTDQYRIYKNYSDSFLMQPITEFINIVPSSFQRSDLSPTWTSAKSPWLLVGNEIYKPNYNQFSFTRIQKHTDSRIIAVVVRTVQQVVNANNLNGIDIIWNCLEKYKKESEKICNKYRQQGYSDYEIDSRLKENQILVSNIRKEFPLWNVLRTDCNICKQTYGSPSTKISDIFNPSADDTRLGTEQVIEETIY